jgi:hypothetical protein
MRTYKVSSALLGVMYSAQNLIIKGDTHQAYKLLRLKIDEIEKASKDKYQVLKW